MDRSINVTLESRPFFFGAAGISVRPVLDRLGSRTERGAVFDLGNQVE